MSNMTFVDNVLQEGLSKLKFHGDLVYKFRKPIVKSVFFFLFFCFFFFFFDTSVKIATKRDKFQYEYSAANCIHVYAP